MATWVATQHLAIAMYHVHAGDMHGTMAAVSGHSSPTGATILHYSVGKMRQRDTQRDRERQRDRDRDRHTQRETQRERERELDIATYKYMHLSLHGIT